MEDRGPVLPEDLDGAGPQDPVEIRARLVSSPAELADAEIHMPERTFYEDRLAQPLREKHHLCDAGVG